MIAKVPNKLIFAFSLCLVLLFLGYLLFRDHIYNWPYVKLSAPNATVVERKFYRNTIEIPISSYVFSHVSVVCWAEHAIYPDFQHCEIWLNLYAPMSVNIEFENLTFEIESQGKSTTEYQSHDLENLISETERNGKSIVKYQTLASLFEHGPNDPEKHQEIQPGIVRKKWFKINLEYDYYNPPEKFKMYSPTLSINGEPHHFPVVTGRYKWKLKFYYPIF